jgi:redox-sensitive bicupin YhaK (pirin superfamily)
MITLRRSAQRGSADHGWLQSRHSFSFADYHDPAHMGVGNLRVINDDHVAPGKGFGRHGHRDMEIVSYVLSGALAHQDDSGQAGHRGVLQRGDVQRMSAGTGVQHSEFNASTQEESHFLQIWILPLRQGIAPGYEQRHFDVASKRGRLAWVATPDAREGSLTLHADATLRAGLFGAGERVSLDLAPQRITYVFLACGSLRVAGHALQAGDAARLDGEHALTLDEGADAEVLVFDLAP